MNPFFLQPGENLLVSSEGVRCFFYTMAVPEECLPPNLRGQEVYLCSRVLPMGFANSVSLAEKPR